MQTAEQTLSFDVLVVDDDEFQLRAMTRTLELERLTVHRAGSVAEALVQLQKKPISVVVSDIGLGEATGLDLLRAIQGQGIDVPVVLVTGAPDLEGAATAVELGAFRYLQKPVATDALLGAVFKGAAQRERPSARPARPRPVVTSAFERALGAMWMAYQPIVPMGQEVAMAHEALLRCAEPTLASPTDFLDAARAAGETRRLFRMIRSEIAAAIARAPQDHQFFVNLQSSDLADEALFDPSEPLSLFAPRVVLELTERASLSQVEDLSGKLGRLRKMGYRIAIDDLGAGYSSLASFAIVTPEVVKLDMSLVRGIHEDPTKTKVVEAVVSLCHGLGIKVVAEGVETAHERKVVESLGCDLLQGYLLGRPERRFTL